MKTTKILLDEKEMPRQWYNVLADMKVPLVPPGIHAGGLRYHGMLPIISSLVYYGKLDDFEYLEQVVKESFKKLPKV